MIRKPAWILFDYGETLIHEAEFDTESGMRAVMRRAVYNPRNATPKQAAEISDRLYPKIMSCARGGNIDVTSAAMQKYVFDLLGVKFDMSYEALDEIFWDAAAPGVSIEGADRLLDYINNAGIKSGVVSNIGFSGWALTNRLNRLLPDSDFKFVIASCDYVFRKPDAALFDLALAFTGVNAEDIWFVGDNAYADIEGAAHAGMFPILLRTDLECGYRDARALAEPNCVHAKVSGFDEIINMLTDIS